MNRCLIVDDQEENRYFLRALMEGNGFEVDCAANGSEALEKARSNPPDFIVSDILMPVMDGFTLCREWRKDECLKTIPFVIYTATYTDSRDRDLAFSLGADRFLIKPLEPEEFLNEISAVIQTKTGEARQPVAENAPPESLFFKQYNETLIRKLESKMLQLEQINDSLKKEINDRIKIEKELLESKGQLSSIFNTVGEAIFNLAVDGDERYRFISVNRAFYSTTGFNAEEILGKMLNEVIPESSLPTMLEKCKQAMAHNAIIGWEDTHHYPTGRLTVATKISPVFDDRGQCTHLVGSFHDISGRKQAEERIRKLNEELEQKVSERTAALNEKIAQLEEVNKVFVGREIKMMELKKQIAEMEEKTKQLH